MTKRRRTPGRFLAATALIFCFLSPVFAALLWQNTETEPTIAPETRYFSITPQDPVARLQQEIDAGRATLNFDDQHGYLPAVLKALKISSLSQALVFSKTSLQIAHISRQTPRALYFNDDVYIGWVQNGDFLEIVATDPRWGGQFYILPQKRQTAPRFARKTYECLQCHHSSMTDSVPGFVMRSVYAQADGTPDLSLGSALTRDDSPMERRWGGWYVTGTHGDLRHMGNVTVERSANVTILNRDAGANRQDLRPYFDPAPYLTPHSDIVALLVLGHQAQVHNLITRLQWETQKALRDQHILNRAENQPEDQMRESTRRRIAGYGEPLVRALLFADETPLTAPVRGTSRFAEEFAARGLMDAHQRSLRQFDLKTRLFRYPGSFLMYTNGFDQLPNVARHWTLKRIGAVLNAAPDDPKLAAYARLSREDRRAVREILRATKPEFAFLTAQEVDSQE